jgi:putative flippase GtrA
MGNPSRKKLHATIGQFLRFNAVGILNTALTYCVYAALVTRGAGHYVALVADYAVGIVFGFFANKRLTFRNRRKAEPRAFARMVAVYIPMLALNAALLWVIVDRLRIDPLGGQAAAMIVVAGLSFLAQKHIVFKDQAGCEACNGKAT